MLTFNGSNTPTVGIELELQILDKLTGRLTPKADEIIRTVNSNKIKRELFQSTIEINSTPTTDLDQAKSELSNEIKRLIEVGKNLDVDFIMAGTHPFTSWEEQKITGIKRYQNMIKKIKWPARRMMIFGLHVHVSVPSANQAIYVCNKIIPYLPYLLTLSASSPFWANTNTGLASCRSKIFETLPTAGLPSKFKDWPDYEHFIDSMIQAGSIESHRDIWWDVRPHPDFGTVEVRIFDAVPTLDETIALAALTQSLVQFLGLQFQSTIVENGFIPEWLIRENKWRASRYGIDAKMLTENGNQTSKVTDQIFTLLDQLKPISRELGNYKHLNFIPNIISNGPSYIRQLKLFDGNKKDFNKILNSLKEELINSLI